MRTIAAAFAALLVLASSSAARAAKLNVGDPAPALDVGKWVQGEPVKGIEKGKIHVVEFWATWCGPCRATIPHLNELSKKHADVTFIGVDVWEDDESKVEPFVKEMGEKMTYRVALDNKKADAKGAMASTWMEAAGQRGIPAAFIVDKDAKVAWVGHPATMDKVLGSIVDGTFDAKAEAEKAAKQQALEGQVQTKVVGPLQAGKFDDALAAVDELAKANPEMKTELLQMKVGVLMRKKDLDGAYKVLDEVLTPADTSADRLNDIAWAVLTAPPFEAKRDAERAIGWAKRADEMEKGKNANILDTLARAYAVKGDWDKAVETQEKAVGLAKADDKAKAEKALAAYKEKKVPSAKQSD
jgi:thiol-disulfide isomerase/thioredoxin